MLQPIEPSISSGHQPEIFWKRPIDAIVELLEHLDINKESSITVYQEQNALIPYGIGNEDCQNMLVLYKRDGTIVPFEGSLGATTRRRPRPKVDLDEETNRVWKLLLEDINSQGIDGTDEDKARWWEEERRVFKGRTDSFIARMHLVQGMDSAPSSFPVFCLNEGIFLRVEPFNMSKNVLEEKMNVKEEGRIREREISNTRQQNKKECSHLNLPSSLNESNCFPGTWAS